jgi:hypothetical protein
MSDNDLLDGWWGALWEQVKGPPRGAALRRACKDAYWSTTSGLLLATVILLVTTRFASEKISGLDPRIRAEAHARGIEEDVGMCELGPIDFDGGIHPQASFVCYRNASVT